MTAGRRAKDTLDRYDTPPDVTRAFLEAWGTRYGMKPHICDPAAGAGALIDVVQEFYGDQVYYKWDIEPRRYDISRVEFLKLEGLGYYDLIITNPPYNRALEFVQHALTFVAQDGHVVMLLRLAFLESQRRSAWLRENMPERVYVLSKRPSFDGKGTDSAAYAWFVWRKGHYPDHFEGRLL